MENGVLSRKRHFRTFFSLFNRADRAELQLWIILVTHELKLDTCQGFFWVSISDCIMNISATYHSMVKMATFWIRDGNLGSV